VWASYDAVAYEPGSNCGGIRAVTIVGFAGTESTECNPVLGQAREVAS